MSEEATNHEPSAYIGTRNIRVFISSTFRDMQEERDILIKKIFPQLRKLCEERAVTWTEVDLRWGITDEQKAEGKVLPLCLEEIHRCRPYFIGLLGERYGWVPEANSIPGAFFESQPWLQQHLQNSVTELEILHGVFNEKMMYGHAFFYFRDPKYLESVPTEKRQDFIVESTCAAGKIERLKQKIRYARDEQVCELRENYKDPEQLGEWILEDFTKLINALYPKDHTPEPLDQEAARHEAYARSRRLAFVGREDLLRRMHEHVAAPGKPLVLTGESGCGKSALLAEFVARWRNDHRDDLIIQHYMGSTPESTDWQILVRRILSELKRAFNINVEIPIQREELLNALKEWVVKCEDPRRHVILVLDALNQLAEESAAKQLGWLPVTFPANFHVLLSSLPGESLEVLRKRDLANLYVPLFERADIAPAARAYFKIFSKTPPPNIVVKLESTPAAQNALFLRAVLDELRQFGNHEQLQTKAAVYLSARNSMELYGHIIVRWEDDFEDDTDLVGDTLCLIWAARRGLSESEILDLLGQNQTPFPRGKWTPFFLAIEHALVARNGLLNFGHQYLREAVRDAYLPTDEHCQRAHQRLGAYFHSQATITERTLDELPWQWWNGKDWDKLHETLRDLDFFLALRKHGDSTINYWASLPEHFNPTHTYLNALKELYQHTPRGLRELQITTELGNFFLHFQVMSTEPLLREAKKIADEILANSNQADYLHIDRAILDSYSALGRHLRDTNQIEEAEAAFRRAVAVAEKYFQDDQEIVAPLLTDLSWLLVLTKRLPEAETLIRRAIMILEDPKHGISLELANSLGVFGLLLERKNNLSEAENALTKAFHITEMILGQHHPNLAQCLSNLGLVLHQAGKYLEAETAFRHAVRVLEAGGYEKSVLIAAALNNLAQLLQKLERFSEAESLSRRQLEILRHWGNKAGHNHSYLNASVLNYTGILQKLGYSTQMINTRLGEILYASTTLSHEGQLLRD